MQGIIKHERKNTSVVCFLFLIYAAFLLKNIFTQYLQETMIFSSFDISGNVFLLNLKSNSFSFLAGCVVFLGIISVLQYRESKTGKAGEFLSVLPVKKNQVFGIKTGIGILSYTIPWGAFSAGVLILRIRWDQAYQRYLASCKYAKDILANDSVINLMVYLIFMWCAMTMIYGLFVFMQNICQNSWIAGVIGFGTIFFPYLVLYCLNCMQYIGEKSWLFPIVLYGEPAEDVFIWDAGIQGTVGVVYFSHIFAVMFIQILIAAAFLFISYRLYVKHDLSGKQGFMYYPWMEKAVRLGISFSVVLYISSKSLALDQKCGKTACCILIAATTILIYKISEWVQGKRERRDRNVR